MTTRVEGSTDVASELPVQVVSGPDDPLGCGPKLPAFRWGRDEPVLREPWRYVRCSCRAVMARTGRAGNVQGVMEVGR